MGLGRQPRRPPRLASCRAPAAPGPERLRRRGAAADRGGSGCASPPGRRRGWASHRTSAAVRELDGFPPTHDRGAGALRGPAPARGLDRARDPQPCAASTSTRSTASRARRSPGRSSTWRRSRTRSRSARPSTTRAGGEPGHARRAMVLRRGSWPAVAGEASRIIRALLDERLGRGPLHRQRVRDPHGPDRAGGRPARAGAAAHRARRRVRRPPRPGLARRSGGRSSATAWRTTRASGRTSGTAAPAPRLKRPGLGPRRGHLRRRHAASSPDRTRAHRPVPGP